MIYSLKKDNYKNFDVYQDNVLTPRSYFIPFASLDELENVNVLNERYSSSRVDVLSGEWEFKYYKKRSDIADNIELDTVEFDKITVPSMWQYTGYEEPYYLNARYPFKPNPPHFPEDCPVGVYRKIIEVNKEQYNFVISFLGVAGCFDLFVNGRYVGYSEGSHNTSQFEITEFLVSGKNEIVVVNTKWSNGTYLECQDMFRSNGIFRDVLLIKTLLDSIYDYEVKTTYITDKKYKLEIIPSLKLTHNCVLSVAVFDDGNMIATKSVNASPSEINEITFDELSVEEWSAETPYLYDLVLTLSTDASTVEVIKSNIGFKHIEINKNVFLFNNKKIKLLGVNHHDTNAKNGYVMTPEQMNTDVQIIKEYNCNAVRTSHYPPDPIFLDLCDEYGIYVIDEADIETHGCNELKNINVLSNSPQWRSRYWDRVYRMYERDKNHSSITMWSLGNESGGYKNQDYCYNEIKRLSNIPVHYEGVSRTKRWAYDVISQMYWPQFMVKRITKGKGFLPQKYYKKPYFLCEYAHAMGVGAGELETYVNIFYSADNMLGGCIWEFADHAVYHNNAENKYTYGGDHGEWRHDGNFCVDGLFFPDRTPHSGALQMKNCYRPVRASKINDNKFSFFNHKYFDNAKYTVKYTALSNGESLLSSEFQIDVCPQSSKEVFVDLPVLDEKKNNVIRFDYYLGDINIASEEIELTKGELNYDFSLSKPVVRQSENKLFFDVSNGQIIFNKSDGVFESYVINGKQLFNQMPFANKRGFDVCVFRAPLDNDMYLKKIWYKKGIDKAYTKLVKCNVNENVINCVLDVLTPNCKICTVIACYEINGLGEIKVDYTVKSGKGVPFNPRFGVRFELLKRYENIEYCGLGPGQALSDFKEQALNGVYKNTVTSFREDYIKPQESSMRLNTHWAKITDDSGFGITVFALDKPFIFSANHFTSEMMARATHFDDLKESDTTCVCIDSNMLGAGSNSCGIPPTKKYCIGKMKGNKVSFIVKPVGEQNV